MRITTIGEVWMVLAVAVSTARETGAVRRAKRGIVGDVGFGLWNGVSRGTGGFVPYPCPEKANIPCKQAIGWATVCDAPFNDLMWRGKWIDFANCWHWHWVAKGSKIPECKKAWRDGWAKDPFPYYPNPYYGYTAEYYAGRGWTSERSDCPGYIYPAPRGCEDHIPVSQRRPDCPPSPPEPAWERYYEKPATAQRQGQPGTPGTQQPPSPLGDLQSSTQGMSGASPQLLAMRSNNNRREKLLTGDGRPVSSPFNEMDNVARVPGANTRGNMRNVPGGQSIA